MRIIILAVWVFAISAFAAVAQNVPVQTVLQENRDLIVQSSRRTIEPAINAVADSGLAQAQEILETWQAKNIWLRESDGLFFRGERIDSKTYRLYDLDTGEIVGEFAKNELKQIKPNSGIRAIIATALVRFQLLDQDVERRRDAIAAIERAPEAGLLAPLRASIEGEQDAALKARKTRLESLLTIAYDTNEAARLEAISLMSTDLGVDVRATLNPLVVTKLQIVQGDLPEGLNIARALTPGSDALSFENAYALLVEEGHAPAVLSTQELRASLVENIENGQVGGYSVHELDTQENRIKAYESLVEAGLVSARVTPSAMQEAVTQFRFIETYAEPSPGVTDAAKAALSGISTRVGLSQTADLTLDALSLASIYFLAAIGLAITFGVMGVINMAHGEFIMMGAYTGYVVQQIVPNYTASLIVAVPMAFLVTFMAGVAMERLVIRWLYNRPLETLLATFGISIALQQLAKNIFGTQARPLTSPAWLDGALHINAVISISYIRIAIFVLALIFMAVFLYIMHRTRLGLETRAVTQNRQMAASMGINADRVNMLTFGLGSGIAGIAGVAIGLFAKVTSELGSDYIVQSFMTVVVGGVGNIWGTLAGAAMIGFFQKGVEWMNPSNTLAAQTYMIIFIIIFIQFRPRGIIALKGRAAGD